MAKDIKIQFEILELQVEKMFQECLNISESKILEEKFSEIRELILACGWTEDDYTARMWGWSLRN